MIVFLPQILILFLFILLLEDFGYMARAAFLMDRIMGGAGLHGRAFIPLLSSFACAIPGIMATRVIDNRRDRLTTILVAPLMTCSARIPVYTLIIAAFIPGDAAVGLGQPARPGDVRPLRRRHLQRAGRLLRRQIVFWREDPSPPFMLELPDYKLPRLQERRARPVHTRQDVPQARRHDDLLDDGADLVPGLVPAPAGRRERAGDRLQPRGDDRPRRSSRCSRRSASTGRSLWR